MSSSDWIIIPTMVVSIKFMFQTTNQPLFHSNGFVIAPCLFNEDPGESTAPMISEDPRFCW